MENIIGGVVGLVIGLIIGLILLAIVTIFFQWLWNTTVPEVFGLRQINFGQALRILILASMLFGGPQIVGQGGKYAPSTGPDTTGQQQKASPR